MLLFLLKCGNVVNFYKNAVTNNIEKRKKAGLRESGAYFLVKFKITEDRNNQSK